MSDTTFQARLMQLVTRRPVLRIGLIIVVLLILIINHLGITLWKLVEGAGNLKRLGAEALPPDFSVLTERAGWAYPACTYESDFLCSPAVIGMTQTIEIAILATEIGRAHV